MSAFLNPSLISCWWAKRRADPTRRRELDSVARVKVGSKTVCLGGLVANPSEEYDRVRPIIYPYGDVTLLCFAVDEVASFENVQVSFASTPWISYV